mgnify:CR=1 FL=1
MKPLACIAVMLGTVQALHPALVTSCIAEQLSSGLDNVKTCLECFEAIEDPLSEEGVRAMKVYNTYFFFDILLTLYLTDIL